MTDKQKSAVSILNRLHELRGQGGEGSLTDEEYFVLMEFVFEPNPQIQYIPFYQPNTFNPITYNVPNKSDVEYRTISTTK